MDIHTLRMGSGSVVHYSNYNISGSNQDIIENEAPLDSEYCLLLILAFCFGVQGNLRDFRGILKKYLRILYFPQILLQFGCQIFWKEYSQIIMSKQSSTKIDYLLAKTII